jgi:hypothetical protein
MIAITETIPVLCGLQLNCVSLWDLFILFNHAKSDNLSFTFGRSLLFHRPLYCSILYKLITDWSFEMRPLS